MPSSLIPLVVRGGVPNLRPLGFRALLSPGTVGNSDNGIISGKFVAFPNSVELTRVLVARDGYLLQDPLPLGAAELLGREVEEQHVVVRAVGRDLVSLGDEPLAERPGVGHHLTLVHLELLRGRHLHGHGDAGDVVVVRAALQAGEDGHVDPVLVVVKDLLPVLVHRLDA